MARYGAAVWDPITQWPTAPYWLDGNANDWKVVWHVTVGSNYPRSTYVQTGGVPHFTFDRDGTVYQHYDTNHYSRALLNLSGGVQTNLDQAIQIEIVALPVQPLTVAQRVAIERFVNWLHTVHPSIQRRWIGRRPPARSYALANSAGWRLSNSAWDDGNGHCGHSDVPENTHWDPAWTQEDWEWFVEFLEGASSGPPPSNTRGNGVIHHFTGWHGGHHHKRLFIVIGDEIDIIDGYVAETHYNHFAPQAHITYLFLPDYNQAYNWERAAANRRKGLASRVAAAVASRLRR